MALNNPQLDPIGTTLLYAVSDLGDATREQFSDWCTTLGISQPWSHRRSLDRLGHIELLRGERKEFSAAPAALVEASPENQGNIVAFLAGRRDPATLNSVRQAAEMLGITVEVERQDPAPERLTLRSPSRAALHRLAELSQLSWAGPAALKLARLLRQPLLKASLPADRLDNAAWFSFSPPSRFSLENRPAEAAALCEVQSFGRRRYFLVANNDAWPVDRREGVHALAALLKNDRVVAYQHSDLRLSVRQALPLPRLHERAAVLCSGREPVLSSGWHRYSQVGPEVASHIMSALAPLMEAQ
jgi:hypothetical protein